MSRGYQFKKLLQILPINITWLIAGGNDDDAVFQSRFTDGDFVLKGLGFGDNFIRFGPRPNTSVKEGFFEILIPMKRYFATEAQRRRGGRTWIGLTLVAFILQCFSRD